MSESSANPPLGEPPRASDPTVEQLLGALVPGLAKDERARFALKKGDVVDGLTVGDPLGAGAAGEVYEVYDPALGQSCALKLLRRQGEAQEAAFLREISLLAALRHPNIVRILRAGRHEGRPYFVMERLAPLPERPSPAQVFDWTLALCDAVAELSARGVAHRDIKPANILWDAAHGQPVLADFGIATPFDNSLPVGTPGASAPEQFRGVLTPASDVYALAAFARALLPPEVAAAPPWRAPLANALAADPALRPADARAFAKSLLDAVFPPRRSRRTALVLGVAVGLAVLAALCWRAARLEAPRAKARSVAVRKPAVLPGGRLLPSDPDAPPVPAQAVSGAPTPEPVLWCPEETFTWDPKTVFSEKADALCADLKPFSVTIPGAWQFKPLALQIDASSGQAFASCRFGVSARYLSIRLRSDRGGFFELVIPKGVVVVCGDLWVGPEHADATDLDFTVVLRGGGTLVLEKGGLAGMPALRLEEGSRLVRLAGNRFFKEARGVDWRPDPFAGVAADNTDAAVQAWREATHAWVAEHAPEWHDHYRSADEANQLRRPQDRKAEVREAKEQMAAARERRSSPDEAGSGVR